MSDSNQLSLLDSSGDPVYLSPAGKTVIDKETGEELYLQSLRKNYHGERHFWKVFLLDFLAVLGIIESKQLEVVVYIMEHTSPYNNQFVGSNRAIADELGVSRDTVSRTMRKLLACNFLTKTATTSVYTVNPSVMMQGSAAKQRGLIIQYVDDQLGVESRAKGPEMLVADATVDEGLDGGGDADRRGGSDDLS